MFLSGALFVLFITGCWLYCLTDAILTLASECPGPSKWAWIAVLAVTFIVGAVAWLIARQLYRAQSRVPAPQPRWAWSMGPDDDLEFIRALEAVIRRNPPVS